MYLFDVASRHMAWLSERQSVTASNIANADTPGYRAKVISGFEEFLGQPGLALAVTSPAHFSLPASEAIAATTRDGSTWGSAHSGNNVSLEQELMTASSSVRMTAFDTNVVRSFHRMFLASVKV